MNKRYILRKSQDIEKLVKLKISIGNKYYAIYHQQIKTGPQIAITASKKVGNAVVRNYQKRVTKEIVRKRIKQLDGLKMLIVVKTNANQLTYSEKKDTIEYLLKKIRKIYVSDNMKGESIIKIDKVQNERL